MSGVEDWKVGENPYKTRWMPRNRNERQYHHQAHRESLVTSVTSA